MNDLEQMAIISIHAPRGGSDTVGDFIRQNPKDFNPRSPWGERPLGIPALFRCGTFQSTLPVGGATFWSEIKYFRREISIHAPRGGSDIKITTIFLFLRYFNPRSPWGERRIHDDVDHKGRGISIHAPRGGSDSFGAVISLYRRYFNPRSPWGERHHGSASPSQPR